MSEGVRSLFLKNTIDLAFGHPKFQPHRNAPPSLWERLTHLSDHEYHYNRITTIASDITEQLKCMPRKRMPEAFHDQLVSKTRKFLNRDAYRLFKDDPKVKECASELLAYKLGITSDAFDRNLGFETFACESRLEHYLPFYGTKNLDFNSDGEILLNRKGIPTPWSEIHAQLSPVPQKKPGQMQQLWYYGLEGVQSEDTFDWTELKPFTVGNPDEWGNQYVIELCACSMGSFWFGTHTWFRLKTPTGEIYSIGLYRPEKKPDYRDSFDRPFRTKKGHLTSPDISEYYPLADIKTIQIAITDHLHTGSEKRSPEVLFKQIIELIEKDKQEDILAFNLVTDNCSIYATRILKTVTGIDLPTGESIHSIIYRNSLPRKIRWLTDKIIPEWVAKITVAALSVFSNLFITTLGATILDVEVKMRGDSTIKPHINSFWDLFKPRKSYGHHPQTLMHRTYPWVMAWRENETKRVEREIKTKKNEIFKLQVLLDIETNKQNITYIETYQQHIEAKRSEVAKLQKKLSSIAYNVPKDRTGY